MFSLQKSSKSTFVYSATRLPTRCFSCAPLEHGPKPWEPPDLDKSALNCRATTVHIILPYHLSLIHISIHIFICFYLSLSANVALLDAKSVVNWPWIGPAGHLMTFHWRQKPPCPPKALLSSECSCLVSRKLKSCWWEMVCVLRFIVMVCKKKNVKEHGLRMRSMPPHHVLSVQCMA